MTKNKTREFCIQYLANNKVEREPKEAKSFTFLQDLDHFRRCIRDLGFSCIKPRHVKRLVLDHLPWKAIAVCACIAAATGIEDLAGAGKAQEADVKQATRQFTDTDHAKRQPAHIINNKHGELTITFTDCRENEKHHVSCKFTDNNGEDHWTYLAGVTLDDVK